MLVLKVKPGLLLLSVAFCLCDGQVCPQGDVTLTANECTEPDQLFNSTVSVLPGSTIILTCSIIATGVWWNSSQFAMPIMVGSVGETAMESGITFRLDTAMSVPRACASATATITNVQESMDGLDLICYTKVQSQEFTSTVVFDVIDPPDPVVSVMAEQYSNTITTSWTKASSGMCPITGYSVSISDVSDEVMHVSAGQTSHNYSINSDISSNDNVCGKTLEINVSAISASGASNVTSANIPVSCTPTNVSVVSISDESAVIQWTHTDVAGVTWYRVVSMSGGMSSVTSPVSTNVNMASVRVNDYTHPVMFTVTSLTAGSESAFTDQENLPAIKYENVVEPASEMGTVTFPFQHTVMGTGLLVSIIPSPVNEPCDRTLSEMAVVVNCSDLTNGVGYTVTLRGTLSVEGTQLPFTFSQSFTPTSSPPSPPPTTGSSGAVVVSASVTVVVMVLLTILCR